MTIQEQPLQTRTKQFALCVIRLAQALPKDMVAQTIGRQVLRSGMSVGANYRAACRAKSTADMIAKLAIVEEEADETMFWLELLIEADIVPSSKLTDLMKEADEIVAMVVASMKTLKSKTLRKAS
jgi:four helix bundle protein